MTAWVRAGAGVHARRFGEEIVLLDVRGGAYFSLNEVGGVIWETIERGASADDAIAKVVDAFDVAEETARRDTDALVAELLRLGLVEASERGP